MKTRTNQLNNLPITIDFNKINDFCKRNYIKKLSLFGSVLRKDFQSNSDVDFLVFFDPEKTQGYLTLSGMENQLSDIIGRQADLRTPAELSRYFRDQVLQEALVIYDKGR